jgi:ribonuclease BN (tRNA processing enzyme)
LEIGWLGRPVEDVGRIAQEAGVKTLVLSHLGPAIDSISDDTRGPRL